MKAARSTPIGYRDAPLLLIGEGTSEIQRMVIGRKLIARSKA